MHMRKAFFVLIILAFILSGCNFPLLQKQSTQFSTPIPISDLLINAGGKYRASATPFQPIPVTPTVSPTPTKKPTKTPENAISVASLGLPRPDGQVNILLLGSDWRANQGYRTDVIMILSLNTKKGSATLTSFPRDLYVQIPGVGYERINTTQAYGGFALTQAMFKDNFGVPVDYYMMTNFQGFQNIINILGGINVNAAYALTDTCSLKQNVNGYCTIPAGMNRMNGETALWYVRSRYSTNDFDRTRRAQEVIAAIFAKLMSLDAVNRSAELYDMFKSSVETNLNLEIVVKLIPVASKILADTSIVKRYAIGPGETYDYIVPYTGAMVLIPDDALVRDIIQKAFYDQ